MTANTEHRLSTAVIVFTRFQLSSGAKTWSYTYSLLTSRWPFAYGPTHLVVETVEGTDYYSLRSAASLDNWRRELFGDRHDRNYDLPGVQFAREFLRYDRSHAVWFTNLNGLVGWDHTEHGHPAWLEEWGLGSCRFLDPTEVKNLVWQR